MRSLGLEGPAGGGTLCACLLLVLWAAASCGTVGGRSPSPSAPPATVPCCTHGPTAPAGALSRDDAVARALSAVPSGSAPVVVWASVVENPFEAVDSAHGLVWAVRMSGLAAPSCSPPARARPMPPSWSPCLDVEDAANIALDVFTGQLLGWYP